MASQSLLRFSLLIALCQIVVAQAPLEQPGEATTLTSGVAADVEPTEAAGNPCDACQLVADVAGLVWYDQVFINTAATEVVGVGQANGSRATRTSVYQNEGDFTYAPGGAGGGALTQVNFQPSITVSGAVLTSPTAYNVFTGYTITSAYQNEGSCVTTTIVSTLDKAYSETLSSANGRVYLDANGQKQFIDFLGFSTCSGGGENISPTALLQVSNTTATSTTSFSGLLASASFSIAAQSSPASASASPTQNATFPSVGVPELVIGNKTITPTPNPIGLPVFNGTTYSSISGVPVPTSSITPFVGAGSYTSLPAAWLVGCVVGLIGFGAGVYYM